MNPWSTERTRWSRFPAPRDARHAMEHGWGTCAGKNYLLAALLQAAGVPAAPVLATGDLCTMLPKLPANLHMLPESGTLADVQSFLKVRRSLFDVRHSSYGTRRSGRRR